MSKYGFHAEHGDADIPFEFVMQDGKPVKLGDGTFGCVFQVHGMDRHHALKIFYENSDEFVLQSQRQEMSIGRSLKQHYMDDHAVAAAIEKRLVVPLSYLENFKDTCAYKSLMTYFENMSFKISNKAIVLEYFPMSLKDLLERGWPRSGEESRPTLPEDGNGEQPIGRGAGGAFGDRSGYSILRSLTQSDREACTLPLIRDVAQGLAILHGVQFRHQDIKPANVLVRAVGENIEAAVADLGFIDTGRWQVHGSIWQSRTLGTRHYRSPEQTDFFDVCEVDVTICDNGEYELTTRDPKFLNTFSEPGDLIVFSKLPEPIQWEITNIELPKGEVRGEWVGDPIKIRIKPLDRIQLQPDKRTQISVNKKQTARTDLFGLGAVIYDMLTCGRSPEQFYDLLRAHDRKGENIENGLAQRYLHFTNGGGTVPEVDAVFQNLRVDTSSEFPSLDMVKIVLKCMMSRPEDSYYNVGKGSSMWEEVQRDLKALSREYGIEDAQRQIEENFLTSPNSPPVNPLPRSTRLPGDVLRAIQLLSYTKPAERAERLVRGVKFFLRVADMIKKELVGGSDFKFLVDVSPNNLRENRNDFVPQYTFFETEEELENLLSSGNPRIVLQTLSAGNLLPPFMNSLVRDCEVWVHGEEGEGSCAHVFFDSWGPNLGWPGLNEGDHLSINLSSTETINAKIISEKGGLIVLDLPSGVLLDKLDTWRRYRAVIARLFAPSDYYIAMLGIYVRLIFFVDPANRRVYTPEAAFRVEHLGLGRRPWDSRVQGAAAVSMLDRLIGGRNKEDPPLEPLFQYLSELYLRLVTRRVGTDGSGDEFSLALENPGQVIPRVLDELRERVALYLKFDGDRLINGDERSVIEEIKSRSYKVSAFPDIGRLADEVVRSLPRS